MVGADDVEITRDMLLLLSLLNIRHVHVQRPIFAFILRGP